MNKSDFIIKTKLGFTLIEMVIVLVMAALLAAVAMPMYTDYVGGARRSEGVASVLAVLTGAKTYYQDNGSFPGALADVDVDVADALPHWSISLTPNASGIVISAAGKTGGSYAGLSAVLTYTLAAGGNTTVIVDEDNDTIFD